MPSASKYEEYVRCGVGVKFKISFPWKLIFIGTLTNDLTKDKLIM